MKCKTKIKQLMWRSIIINWKHCIKMCRKSTHHLLIVKACCSYALIMQHYILPEWPRKRLWKFCWILFTLIALIYLTTIFSGHCNLFFYTDNNIFKKSKTDVCFLALKPETRVINNLPNRYDYAINNVIILSWLNIMEWLGKIIFLVTPL